MSTKKKVAVKIVKKQAVKKAPAKKLVLPRMEFSEPTKDKDINLNQDTPRIDFHTKSEPNLEQSLRSHCDNLHTALEESRNPFIQLKNKQNELASIQNKIECIEKGIENLDSIRESAVGIKNKIQTQLEGLRKLVIAEIN